MNGVIIANEVELYHGIAVSLRMCNNCFISPFAIVGVVKGLLKCPPEEAAPFARRGEWSSFIYGHGELLREAASNLNRPISRYYAAIKSP